MSLKDAVERFVKDGDYLAIGGFGTSRTPIAACQEIVRQGRKNMGFAGHTSTHDFQILAAGEVFNRVDIAYIIGLEARGMSQCARAYMESGQVKICEWSNFSLAARLKAAAMGIPFLPTRNMIGTDTFKYSAGKIMTCPFTGKTLALQPALYPDASVIHVHEADISGNCRIQGIVISDDDLERLEDDYVEAARLALDAGFRGVDIKATHGYLLSELLSAKRREGRYGGSLENRTRLFKNVFGKIRAAVGSRLKLCVRLGCYDGVPYVKDPESSLGVPAEYACPYDGFGVDPDNPLREDLSEVKQVVAWFQEWGVELLNISLGSPYMNPHMGRPFEKPDEGNYEPPEHPLLGVDRHFRVAGELQRAFPDLPMVGTGYSWLQRYMINAAAWNIDKGNIRIFGAGRAALPYPGFALDALEKGELDESRVCKTLTYCTYLMRQKQHPLGQFPTGCVPFDKNIYGTIMKQAREAERAAKRTPEE